MLDVSSYFRACHITKENIIFVEKNRTLREWYTTSTYINIYLYICNTKSIIMCKMQCIIN